MKRHAYHNIYDKLNTKCHDVKFGIFFTFIKFYSYPGSIDANRLLTIMHYQHAYYIKKHVIISHIFFKIKVRRNVIYR